MHWRQLHYNFFLVFMFKFMVKKQISSQNLYIQCEDEIRIRYNLEKPQSFLIFSPLSNCGIILNNATQLWTFWTKKVAVYWCRMRIQYLEVCMHTWKIWILVLFTWCLNFLQSFWVLGVNELLLFIWLVHSTYT